MSNEDQAAQISDPAADSTDRKALRTVRGIVRSDKMNKTIIVEVSRKVRHPVYEKFVSQRARLYAHDENGEAKSGDTVEIAPIRRMSKNKTWRLVRIVQKAAS